MNEAQEVTFELIMAYLQANPTPLDKIEDIFTIFHANACRILTPPAKSTRVCYRVVATPVMSDDDDGVPE